MCCYIIQQFIFPLLVLISRFRCGGKVRGILKRARKLKTMCKEQPEWSRGKVSYCTVLVFGDSGSCENLNLTLCVCIMMQMTRRLDS